MEVKLVKEGEGRYKNSIKLRLWEVTALVSSFYDVWGTNTERVHGAKKEGGHM